MFKTILALVVLFDVQTPITAYPAYADRIPNGRYVPNPCVPGQTWGGVGHEIPGGTGPLNAFGRDFLANGKIWSEILCVKDSDGDGKTNGEELGDPLCQWREGVRSFRPSDSHPGICEPIDSPRCLRNNGFIFRIPECKGFQNSNNNNGNAFGNNFNASFNANTGGNSNPLGVNGNFGNNLGVGGNSFSNNGLGGFGNPLGNNGFGNDPFGISENPLGNNGFGNQFGVPPGSNGNAIVNNRFDGGSGTIVSNGGFNNQIGNGFNRNNGNGNDIQFDNLFDGTNAAVSCPQLMAERKVQVKSLKFDSVNIPSQDSLYVCQEFNLPGDTDYEIIAVSRILNFIFNKILNLFLPVGAHCCQ